jgi:hypothetical protein
MIYIPSFIKIGSGIQRLLGGATQVQHSDHVSLLSLFPNKKNRVKTKERKTGRKVITLLYFIS